MSKQRRPHDDHRDHVVSQAYHELAQEHAPAHLDHVVLNEARKEAKRRRSHQFSWLRPAAWVTTVGLCLAIVLEVTDMVPEDIAADRTSVTEEKDTTAKPQVPQQKRIALPASADIRTASPDDATEGRVDAPAPTAAGADAEEMLPGVSSEAAEVSKAFKSESDAAMEFESLQQDDALSLRDAAEPVRRQESAVRESIGPVSRAASPVDTDDERYCDEQETATPEAWVECIMRLQMEGRHDEARQEYDRLHETFPGAEIPPLTTPMPSPP